jgi:predicted  nucleic acid-binding Zn-ribbon protein
MENLYVWLLISSGAILGLAGLLLFASERKRGKQRPQFEEPRRNYQNAEVQELRDKVTFLSRRLEESQRRVEELQETGARSSNQYAAAEADLAAARQQVDKVMTRNRALLDEVDSLSTKLSVSQKTVEDLLTLENDLSGAESDGQRLRTENQALQQEIAGIKGQLESRLGEIASQHQEPIERDSELRAASLELQQQLEASEKTIEELRAEQDHWHGIEAQNQLLQQEVESLREELQARLLEAAQQSQESGDRYARAQTEIAKLKEQAEKGQANLLELETVRQQLAGFESREDFFKNQQRDFETQAAGLRQELSAEKERVRELELTRGLLEQTEDDCRKLQGENRRLEGERTHWQERMARSEEYERQAGVLRQRLDELTKQALLIDSEDQHYKEIVGGDLAGGSWRRRSDYDAAAAQNRLSIESTAKPIDAPLPSNSNAAKEKKTGRRNRSVYQKWGLRIVPVTGVMAIAAAVALGFLTPSSDERSGSEKPMVVSHSVVSDEQAAPSEATPESQKPAPASAAKGESANKAKQAAKPEPRLRGSFEITRPTQVYSGPSEITLAIARIEPGTKINVIDSRDGWLEIRSKHGRPPGFIRQEAAVRINPDRG